MFDVFCFDIIPLKRWGIVITFHNVEGSALKAALAAPSGGLCLQTETITTRKTSCQQQLVREGQTTPCSLFITRNYSATYPEYLAGKEAENRLVQNHPCGEINI